MRFNLAEGSSARFADTLDFIDLTIGLDGGLYALDTTGNVIRAYDPASMGLLQTITLPSSVSVRSVAVDQGGDLFTTGLDGVVRRFNAMGVELHSGTTEFTFLTDIDVAPSGRLVVGQDDGRVIVGDLPLDSFTSFVAITNPNASSWTTFVALTEPVAESPALGLLGSGLVGLAILARRRGRKPSPPAT